MNKKPIMLAIMTVALIGMIMPFAEAGEFKSYIFKEDFDSPTLDNQTWINTSDPFPYEIKDGNIIIHFDPEPLEKYAKSKPKYFGMKNFHGEFDFTVYTSRYQNDSAVGNIVLGTSFVKKTNVSNSDFRKHEVFMKIIVSNSVFTGGRFTYYLQVSNRAVSKSESYDFRGYSFGREIPFKYVFDVQFNGSEMTVYQQLYKEQTLAIANKEIIKETNRSIVTEITVSKNNAIRPIDGYLSLDSIAIGEYVKTPEKQNIEPHRYFITTGIIMLTIASMFLFFADKYELADMVGIVAFYMALGLFVLSFLTYPEPILGIPSVIYALFPISLILLGVEKTDSLFGEVIR